MKQIIGKNISFIRRSLKPNSIINLQVTMTDSLKKDFHTRVELKTESDGSLNLHAEKMRSILALCKTDPQRAFIFAENVDHKIKLECDHFVETIDIETGIEETIFQEHWAGQNGVFGYLYYPSNKKSKRAIVHIQGSTEICQNHRSIALANEGFTVLELMYNAPRFGLDQFYTTRYFDISYIQNAIHEVLLHPSTQAERVIMIGHSKGSDLCICAGSLFPELVYGAI